MSVWKAPKEKFYRYDFRIDGHRFHGSTRATTRREAEAFEDGRRRQAPAEIAEAAKQRAAAMTVDVACQRYWTEKGQHEKRADHVEVALAWLCQMLGKETPLKAVSNSEVARIVAIRRGQSVRNMAREKSKRKDLLPPKLVSPATVNRQVVDLLRKIVRRAESLWGEAVQKIDWAQHRLKEPEERVRELKPDEEARLFDHLPQIYHALIMVALRTGLREDNCVSLTWDQIDFGNRSITVIAKGGRRHVLPMTPAIREILWSQRGRHSSSVWAYDDGRPFTVHGAVIALKRALTRAEIANFRFHDLRHTAATRMGRVTGNLLAVKNLLGHTDIKTTSRYTHFTSEDLRTAMERLDQSDALPPSGALKKSAGG